jgi:deoxyadenosine/deoxycytidine kinase
MISIEGLIGCGKSELLKVLESRGLSVKQEPVQDWTLLPHFYKDPRKYSFAFQLQILTSFVAPSDAQIKERSARCALEVFARMLLDSKAMTQGEYSTLCCNYLYLGFDDEQTVVYLKVDPKTCLKRIQERGRESEENITLEYLMTLQTYYQNYLDVLKESNVCVFEVDCLDRSPNDLADEIESLINSLPS